MVRFAASVGTAFTHNILGSHLITTLWWYQQFPLIPSEHSLLSKKKIFQIWGSILNPYLFFACAKFSFHVCSWNVSYLSDHSVSKLSLCGKECEDKVGFGHILGKAGQSALVNGAEGKKALCGGDTGKTSTLGDRNLRSLKTRVWFSGTVSPAGLNSAFF